MCHCRSYLQITGRRSKEFCALQLMVSIILAKSICCWQHFSLWNGLGPWGENFGLVCFLFFLLFLASKNHGSRASKRAKGRLNFSFFLSFLLNICYILGEGKKIKWLSKLRVNGEQKKKKPQKREGAKAELPSGHEPQATPN